MRRLISMVAILLFCAFPLCGATGEERSVAQARLNALVDSLRAGTLATVSAGDANGDGMVTVADIFYLINFLFTGGPAPAAVTLPDTPNPQQIAILRWYSGNQSSISFAVGNTPISLAFDGASVWVANEASGTLTKLRASDGASLGTFGAGGIAMGLAFDGANIWVAGGVNVRKLQASDGALLRTFAAGAGPTAVAFDGANIWVANTSSNNVTKLQASDGLDRGTFPAGSVPAAVAFDGTNIWVVNAGSNNVTKLRAFDGVNQGTFAVATALSRSCGQATAPFWEPLPPARVRRVWRSTARTFGSRTPIATASRSCSERQRQVGVRRQPALHVPG